MTKVADPLRGSPAPTGTRLRSDMGRCEGRTHARGVWECTVRTGAARLFSKQYQIFEPDTVWLPVWHRLTAAAAMQGLFRD